jgi:hypothetical protein
MKEGVSRTARLSEAALAVDSLRSGLPRRLCCTPGCSASPLQSKYLSCTATALTLISRSTPSAFAYTAQILRFVDICIVAVTSKILQSLQLNPRPPAGSPSSSRGGASTGGRVDGLAAAPNRNLSRLVTCFLSSFTSDGKYRQNPNLVSAQIDQIWPKPRGLAFLMWYHSQPTCTMPFPLPLARSYALQLVSSSGYPSNKHALTAHRVLPVHRRLRLICRLHALPFSQGALC